MPVAVAPVLSKLAPIYQPALTQRPTNWLLFLKITGGFYKDQSSTNLMDGPGNFAIDEFGFVWINDNYDPRPSGEFACAGRRLIRRSGRRSRSPPRSRPSSPAWRAP